MQTLADEMRKIDLEDEQFKQQFATLAQHAATATSRDIIDLLK